MKRILVIRFSAMGDVAMTLPVMKLILKENPNIEINFLTRKNFTCIFENIDRLIPIGVDLEKEYNGFWGLKKLHKDIVKNGKFDAIIDLHHVLRTNIIDTFFRLSGIPVFTINKERSVKRKMIQTKSLYPLPHTTNRYLDVFKKAKIKVASDDFLFPSVVISEKDKQIALDFLRKINGPYIAFAPFAKHATKTYPIVKSEELIAALTKKFSILLLGGKENAIQFEHWEQTYKNTYSTISFSLTQQIALMSSMQTVISMDSANMHLAAIQGVPVISIWGATHPYFGFSGIGTTLSSWISTDDFIECRPCSVFGNKPCTNMTEPYACMNHIKPESILSAIEIIVESAGKQ